jgi:hypothetical protein
VDLDNPLGNKETEAEPFLLGGEVRSKEVWLVLRRYARAGIAYLDANPLFPGNDAHGHLTSARARFQGIDPEVEERLG